MPPRPLYQVPKAAYLFTKAQMFNERGDAKPEEIVRQWCAFELLRNYCYSILDLDFETPVKVGSKTYRIDILIRRHSTPFAVVECKRATHTKTAEGIAQAKSYADAATVRAPFAIYTNGASWVVERKIGKAWHPCIDLPFAIENSADESLEELYLDLSDFGTLIHKMDTELVGEDARSYLGAMMDFFQRRSRFTSSTDKNLLNAADYSLRAILHYKSDDRHYIGQKLGGTLREIEEFRKKAVVGHEPPFLEAKHGFTRPFQQTRAYLFGMLEGSRGIESENSLILKLLVSLFDYGMNLPAPGNEYPAISLNVFKALREYLDFNLQLHLNMPLPDPNEGWDFKELQNHCFEKWNDHKPL